MLGINSKREPIRGEYAKELREILRRVYSGKLNEQDLEFRVYSGKLNEQDLELIRKHKEILKDWNIVWK